MILDSVNFFSSPLSKNINFPNFSLMERIDAVVNCTPIRVNIKSKLTNFMINSRIEGYNDE